CALFLTTALGFSAYRYSSFAVWNDSPCVFHPRGSDDTGPGWDEEYRRFRQAPLAGVAGVCRSVEGGGYRPLSASWTYLAAVLFYNPRSLPFPLLLVVGAVHGAQAVSLFCVARRFVKHDLT